jgi:hypothetical protein
MGRKHTPSVRRTSCGSRRNQRRSKSSSSRARSTSRNESPRHRRTRPSCTWPDPDHGQPPAALAGEAVDGRSRSHGLRGPCRDGPVRTRSSKEAKEGSRWRRARRSRGRWRRVRRRDRRGRSCRGYRRRTGCGWDRCRDSSHAHLHARWRSVRDSFFRNVVSMSHTQMIRQASAEERT